MTNMEDRLYLSHISAISATQVPKDQGMARSKSTPALENQPTGVVTRITHTRYIRAGSAEPHRSIYSVFSNLDGHRRSSSVSRSDWSRGSSLSRGSSTESLMTMAEARKRREGSQESVGSTRSLKVISAKSITTGVPRRGAKLNKDIQAPWGSSEKVPRVISSPSLPTSAGGGGGGSSQSTTAHSSARTGPNTHKHRRASIEIPKHLEEIERRLGITPKFKSAPDVNIESKGRVSPKDDTDNLPLDGRDDFPDNIEHGEQPLDVEVDHVTCERSSEVHARVGIRRRHTDLPERVARSRAKAEEEEARREREKEARKEPPPPPPSPVTGPEVEVNKTNGVFTGRESDIQDNTGQREEAEQEELTTETQAKTLLVETDIDTVVTQLDLDNPTPSKKRKVERTTEGGEEEQEQERENKDEGGDFSVSYKMEGKPGPTPTPGAEGEWLPEAGGGAAGGPVPSNLLETEINYSTVEPHTILPGGQGLVGEDEDDEEFEIEVEVVPESYMETPEYEEEEEPEYDQTLPWEQDTPSYDDSDYYSYISESFERRDRVLRAMRERDLEEIEMVAAHGDPLSPQSSLDDSEYSAYDDYVIPYISKGEPPARHSMDLSDYSDELNQVPAHWELDSQVPPGAGVSDRVSQPPASFGAPKVPINKPGMLPQEDTAPSGGKPPEKTLSTEKAAVHAATPVQGNIKRTESDTERLQHGHIGKDQRVPEIEGLSKKNEAASQQAGPEADKNVGEVGAAGRGSLNEPLITPTTVPKVASEPDDKTIKRPLKGILKRSGSTDSYHSRDGDAPPEPEPSLKRYSYTEDLSVVEEVTKSVIEEVPKEEEVKAEIPSATLPQGKEIQAKTYFETDIDKSVKSESLKGEKPTSEVEETPVVPQKEKMAEVEMKVPRKRRERTTFPTYSEFSAVDVRDPGTLDYKMRLTILDIIMNFLLITPLVVLHYHALCSLLELIFLQYFPKIGTLLLMCLGIAVEFGCTFFQKSITSSVPRPNTGPDTENIHFILASKAFYFVLAFGNISHMLAASELIDLYIGEEFSGSFKTAVTSLIMLWMLRCGRNVIAPPLYVSIDQDDVGVFSTKTLFRSEHDGSPESGMDTLATTAVVFTFVHLHWAGVWNCLDAIFFPGTVWLSMVTSLSVGYGLCLAFLFLQEPALKISRNLQREEKEPLRIVFENAFNGAANIGVVLLWKGLWMVYDIMADYFPIYCRSWDITPLATTVLSFVLLSLAHCSSSLLFQDCEIDGELKDGEGVLFQTGYLSEIIGEDTKEPSPTDVKQVKMPTSTMPGTGVTSTVSQASASVSKPLQPTKTKSRDTTTTSPNGATNPSKRSLEQ